MAPTLAKSLMVLSLIIQFALSIASLALAGKHQRFIAGLKYYDYEFFDVHSGKWLSEPALPYRLQQSGFKLNVANASLALVISVLLIVIVSTANHDRKRCSCLIEPIYLYPIFVFTTVLNLINMAYNFARHSSAAQFDPYSGTGDVISVGRQPLYDLERWTCGWKESRLFYAYKYHTQCTLETASRFILLVQFIVAVVIFATAVWAYSAEKRKYHGLKAERTAENQIFQ